MGRVTSKVGSKTIRKGKGKTKALKVTPKKSKSGIWARMSKRFLIIKEEVKPTNIRGPKRKSNEEGKVDVTEEEQSKRLKMDEETKKLNQLMATHLGSAEVARQPRQV